MKLLCIKEAILNGKKIMNFTRGNEYTFEEIIDPEGWKYCGKIKNTKLIIKPSFTFSGKVYRL